MRASIRAGGALAIAAAIGTVGVAGAYIAPAVAPAAGVPTLTANRHIAGLPGVMWGQSVKLSGRESSGGTQLAVLQTEAFPFAAGYQTVAETHTTGRYAFNVRPSHATHYRVLTGATASRVVTVYVIDKKLSASCSLCRSSTSGRHTLISKAKVEAPPGTLAVHGPTYVYYGLDRGSRKPRTLYLVKTVLLHIKGHDLSVDFPYVVDFPHGPFQWLLETCTKDQEAKDGVGLPGHHHCGDAHIPAGTYLG